ncbi:LuxR family transcriptional regulator [Nocardioides sp. P86]|uniref:helix-turn-helix transcriptional regulator n=3 Tax=Nocardioides TaxID=1839 RepID=UPI00203F26B2|nr:LuxR family transcriptional regulator [Nocardioides sp. P86]MCM3516376.1 AAA family ATPase [Nocardioides sp. P86]
MSRLVGRRGLLAAVTDLLGRGVPVALQGPHGIGRSALLDELETAGGEAGQLVLRAAGVPAERSLPLAALRDLVAQLPAAAVEQVLQALPPTSRAPVADGLRGTPSTPSGDPRPEPEPEPDPGLEPPTGPASGAPAGPPLLAVDETLLVALGRALQALLELVSRRSRVLLLLDDVQWLDAESSVVVGYARRRLGDRVGLVASLGPGDGIDSDPAALVDLHVLTVPPLEVAETIDLLAPLGLPAQVAHRVHLDAAGVPALALALAGALRDQPALLGRPVPLPVSIERVLRQRLLALPEEPRETLLRAALLHRPTVRQLRRSGRIAAEEDVRVAVAAGLVVDGRGAHLADASGDGEVRFTPARLASVLLDLTPAARRAALHEELAEAAVRPAERARHRALADPRPRADLARELADAARDAAAAGARDLAAELYVLAADRAPADLAGSRAEWLATGIETAAPGNHVDLVRGALADFLDAAPTAEQTVRVRLALAELAGSPAGTLDDVLAVALADAGDDDRLVAMVLLQRSRVALMEARPEESIRRAEQAVELLGRAGDDTGRAAALTALAAAYRWLGGPHDATLARAVELAGPGPGADGLVHTSPGYMAARFAFYDDRLEEAWSAFRAMLAQVERGAGTDEAHVLRCLVEVGARAGHGREVVEYAARAARVGAEFGLDPHTAWFVQAQAELVAGDLDRARRLAGQGASAAEDSGDARYLQRHLVLLGQALLRGGDAEGAARALERVRGMERRSRVVDPTVNRWQHELVTALVRLGRLEEASGVLAEARRALDGRSGTDGVGAQLDRAEAELLTARGDAEGAVLLLDRAAKVCADLGMRVDQGRTLVARAHLERRRRRAAAARAGLEEALALFTDLRARTWVEQVRAELDPAAATVGTPLLDRLTETEARIAREVAAGASNREIAARTYVSVKTVEATLTRIYRKLDVRSRTQLASLLRGPGA